MTNNKEKKITRQPINQVTWKHIDTLKHNDYNPNHVFKPEMKLLAQSLLNDGWLQPIIITQDNTIIDGYHRCTLVKTEQKIYDLTDGMIPTITIPTNQDNMKITTIRINRAHGTHTAEKMHNILTKLIQKGYTKKQIQTLIGTNKEETEYLTSTIYEHEEINQDTEYSKAWIPR